MESDELKRPKHIIAECELCGDEMVCIQGLDESGTVRKYCFPCLEESHDGYFQSE